MAQILRKWVNQPSTLQPDHALHGTNVLVDDTGYGGRPEQFVRVHFLSGPVISMTMARLSLSDGWVGGLDEVPVTGPQGAKQ